MNTRKQILAALLALELLLHPLRAALVLAPASTPSKASGGSRSGNLPQEPATPELRDDYSVTALTPLSQSGALLYNVSSRASSGGVTLSPPKITTQPKAATVLQGGSVSLKVTATSSTPVSYTWYHDGEFVSDAATYTFTASLASAGNYYCQVGNSYGSVLSSEVLVQVTPRLDSDLVGSFYGLVERDTPLNKNLASSIQFTTGATGTISGKYVTGITAVSFTGQLTLSSDANVAPELSMTIPNVGSLTISLDATTKTFTGTLGADSVALAGAKSDWPTVAGNASNYKGAHNFYIKQSAADPTVPEGYGIGVLTVTEKTGVVALTGTLPDGTKLTSSSFLGDNGEVAVYVPCYANLGSLEGSLQITKGANAPLDNEVSGTLSWSKPATAAKVADLVYRDGFGPVSMEARGGYYTPPLTGARILGLAAQNNNAQISFSYGGLDDEGKEFTRSLTVSIANKAVVSSGTNTLAAPVITPKTGLFSGLFTLSGTQRSAAFNGRVVTVDGVSKGYGFFLLPKTPGAGGTVKTAAKLSGEVVLEAAP